MDIDIWPKIAIFFSNYRVRQYGKGQILVLNGDEADVVYYLTEGRVKQYDVTNRGDETILAVFHAPSLFPVSLAISKASSTYIFEAETDIKLRQAPVADVIRLLKSNPDITFALLMDAYKEADRTFERMAYLMSGSAKARLLYELLACCELYGTMKSDGSCVLNLSERDLGARTGLTRETISREMAKLERSGSVRVNSGIITVHDVVALRTKLTRII